MTTRLEHCYETCRTSEGTHKVDDPLIDQSMEDGGWEGSSS